MTLKLIGAGFGRTGTSSTKEALDALGFPCYHMKEVLLNPANADHLAFWREVAVAPPGTPLDWSKVFANYSATVDNPGCCVWRELVAAYPDAKVLLTVHPRGAEAWWESVMDTIYFTERDPRYKNPDLLTPAGRMFADVQSRLVWDRALAGVMDDKAKAVARYVEYIDEVTAAVPKQKLLLFSPNMGWEPLCEFLGVEKPGTPFPNVNDRKSFQNARQAISAAFLV